MQGNQGGEDIADTVRGPMNNGGLYGERAGWSLPGYPDRGWDNMTLPSSSAQPGVGWYRTTFDLDVSKGVDVSLGLTIADDPAKTYRALIFVNGWNLGQYINDVGPQHTFVLPNGILDPNGTNTLAIAVIAVIANTASGGLGSVSLTNLGTVRGGAPLTLVRSPSYVAPKLAPTAVTARVGQEFSGEVAAVTVPADASVGKGRAADFYRNLILETKMETNNIETNNLSRSQRRAAVSDQERMAAANDQERARCLEITEMCRAHKIPGFADDLIREGTPISECRTAVLGVLDRRSKQQSLTANYQSEGSDYLDMGNEAKDFSITRAINAVINNDWRGAGLERAASESIAKRLGRQSAGGFYVPRDALQYRTPYAAGALGTGGAIVATQLLEGSFIEVLRNKSKVIELGATMLTGLVGNVDIPRRTVTTPGYWVAEAGTITEGEGTFDKLSLTPKTIGALSQYSRNMLMQSTPAIEMLVRSDLAAVLSLGIDLAAINGLGSANQPLGIMGTAGIGSVAGGANGAQVTIDNLIDLATAVANANADSDSLAYLTNAKVLGFLSKIKATTGQYLWQRSEDGPNYAPVGGSGNNLSVLGSRLAITNQVPSNLTKGTSAGVCSAVIFGNWSDLIIGEWGILEILPNPYDSASYAKGSVLIRAMQTIDIGVRHAGSFALMADALTV